MHWQSFHVKSALVMLCLALVLGCISQGGERAIAGAKASCEAINSTDYKQICLAVASGDPAECQTLSRGPSTCFWDYARIMRNRTFCDKVEEMYRPQCITDVAWLTNDVRLCAGLPENNSRRWCIAYVLHDLRACMAINDTGYLKLCLAVASGNSTLCSNLTGGYADECNSGIAMQLGAPGNCDPIMDQETKAWCYSYVGRMAGGVDRCGNLPQKDYCEAILTGNSSQCLNLNEGYIRDLCIYHVVAVESGY